VKLSFPGAKIFTQAREWDDARANRSVMTRTYFPDHLAPIAAQIACVDSPRPFIPGYTPERGECPIVPVETRMTEIVPGVHVFLVPGHTWGQQAILFTDAEGREVVFTPDVMPTAAHNGAAYSLGYDVEPYTSMISRQWFLREAAKRDWVLVLDHEPGNPVRRVSANEKGWFDLKEDAL
jgi:glyoxylase-like metal-dependent hydrolase (beta-lactamase superfamily II)